MGTFRGDWYPHGWKTWVEARKSITITSVLPNMLFIWQVRQYKKSSKTLYTAALTYSTLQSKWDMNTCMFKARNLSTMILETCAWMRGLNKQSEKSTMSTSKMHCWIGTWTPWRKSIPWKQFGFMPGRGTTNTIFVVHKLQGKFHTMNKTRCMAFEYLKRAFHRVSILVIWWPLHKLGIESGCCASCRAWTKMPKAESVFGCNLSEEFNMKAKALPWATYCS